MNKVPLYSLLVVAGLIGIQPLAAQTQSTATASTLSPEAQIAAAQANYDAWDKPSQPIGPNHRTTVRAAKTGPRQIVEIGTGINYWNGLQWVPSNPTFVPVANGFIASKLQDPVQLAGDLYTTNAVTIRTPEGIMLGSSPVAVALYDSASGNFAVIATITNSAATLVESNQVLYPDAFSGNVCASVVYTISQGTFHQDVVFTSPLDPADYGFPRDTTRIQIITEFYGAPDPDELDRPLYVEADAKVRTGMVSPDLIDQQLGFGRFVLTTGKAYVTPSQDTPNGLETLVAKEYKTVGDGTYLFESIPYHSIAAALSNLPPCHPSFGSVKFKSTKGYANIPHPGNKPHAGPTMARASHAPVHGVVVDYVANIGGTMSGVTVFQGDTTFLVSSAVSCNGPTTVEGGSVFKYKPGVSITLNSTLTCKTGQYRPAIFTAVDDDTMGDSMTNVPNSGYTGTISSSGYANPALYTQNAMNFSGFRIRYAQEAIRVFGNSTWSVSHAQFVNCIKGIEIEGSGGSGCGCSVGYFNVNNCLFSRVPQPILGTSVGGNVSQYVSLFNATMDHASAFGTLTSCGVNLYIQSTNSIYASVSSNGNVTASGKVNAFYSDGNTFGSLQIPLTNSPFLTFGAGNYYLTNLSGIQTSGITNGLTKTLLSDLAKRTTYPPWVIAGTILSTNLALAPQAYRDTYVSSLGYHYDPIDYAFGNVYASNASVTMSGGVAIATFGTNNSAYGLGFGVGSTFSSYGAPNVPDWIVLFNTVQEGTNLNWQRLTNSVTGELFGATPAPSIFTRFTSWSVLAQDAAQFYAPTNSGPIGFQDSEFHGGKLLSYRPTINLTNCLLERVYANLTTSDGNSPYIRNNLFFGGIFNYAPNVTNSLVKDNLFDQTVISNNSSVYTTYNGGYNAFVTNNNRLLPTNANDLVIMTNAQNYQAGPLGLYYQTNTSVLINAGQNATANQVGLYQYTVCTNLVGGLEVKETNSVVDIGYHYVATDAYGNPIDSNGDGIPDYLADSNGDGLGGSGETNWAIAILVQPVGQSVAVGANAVFSVTAGGLNPLHYQWYFNGTNLLAGATSAWLTITNVQLSQAGNYSVVVTNNYGALTSSNALLTVYYASSGIDFWLAFCGLYDDVTNKLSLSISSPVGATGTVTTPGLLVNGPILVVTNCGDTTVTGIYVLTNLTVQEQADWLTNDFATNAISYVNGTHWVVADGSQHWVMFAYDSGTHVCTPLYDIGQAKLTGNWVYDGDSGWPYPTSLCAQVPLVNQTFTVAKGAVTNISIPLDTLLIGYEVEETNGIHVTATQPISVYAFDYDQAVSAAFTAYPTALLGTNYCVMAKDSGGYMGPPDGGHSQLAIVATANYTTVTITPSTNANLEGLIWTTNFTLQQGEAYLVQSSGGDVTGTWITSDQPVAVFAGADNAFVSGYDYGNPLVQEQLPVEQWGKQALALSFAGRMADTFRVLTANSNTVTISGVVVDPVTLATNYEVVVTNLAAGGNCDIILAGPVEFQGSQPIQVAQFANGCGFDANSNLKPNQYEGDPCEILLPPTGHYLLTNIVFTLTNDLPNKVTGDFDENFLTLIVSQSAITNTWVDGSLVAATNFMAIGTNGYFGAQLTVTNSGAHIVTSSQPVEVQVYGFGHCDAYSYFGGIVK